MDKGSKVKLTAESAEKTETVNREILEIHEKGSLTEGREGGPRTGGMACWWLRI